MKEKKGLAPLIFIGIIGALIIGGTIILTKYIGEGSLLSFTPRGTTINVNAGGSTSQPYYIPYNNADDDNDHDDNTQYIDSSPDLGTYFESNFPVYIANRSLNCRAVGGDWISEDDRMGCYNVPVWDHTLCGSAEMNALKFACANLGAYFTCNMYEVSCENP